MVIVEKLVEWRLAGGETEVLGENLPLRHFCPSQNPTWLDPGSNPGRRRRGKPATNSLSYGAAYHSVFLFDQPNATFFLFGLWGYWHCGHSWPIVPASGNSEDDCGEADGM
jgi:hypothetical protein